MTSVPKRKHLHKSTELSLDSTRTCYPNYECWCLYPNYECWCSYPNYVKSCCWYIGIWNTCLFADIIVMGLCFSDIADVGSWNMCLSADIAMECVPRIIADIWAVGFHRTRALGLADDAQHHAGLCGAADNQRTGDESACPVPFRWLAALDVLVSEWCDGWHWMRWLAVGIGYH